MLVSKVIAELRKIVQLKPETIYSSGGHGCKYADGTCSDGSIGCLFGQVLSNLGEDVKRFDNYPMLCQENIYYTPAIDKILTNEFEGTAEEINWCAKVQEHQDNGCSWKEAVKEADLQFALEPSAIENVSSS